MALWNLGSCAERIHSFISVPSAISGTFLLDLIDQRRIFIEKHLKFSTGTIGSVDIAVDYQGPLFNLSMGKVSNSIASTNLSSASAGNDIQLGEFKINKSNKDKVTLESAKMWENNGMEDLKQLKELQNSTFGYYKANG